MIETTAKELVKEHRKSILRQEQEGYEKRTTEAARASFRRKPYMGIYRKQDQSDPGGHQ